MKKTLAKVKRYFTDPDFGGLSVGKMVGAIFIFVGIVIVAAIAATVGTGGFNRCWEETGPHGHLFTVCNDGQYSTFREHSPDCPVAGCPYGMEVQP